MADPFQIKKAPQSAPAAKTFALRDTAREKTPPPAALRPRSRRTVRAVKLLDVLTSGDEALHAYLTAEAAKAAAQPQTAETAAQDDLINPQLEAPPPPVHTVDFQQLKAALLEQCRQEIAASAVSVSVQLLLSLCGLGGDYCIHAITPEGRILRHYTHSDLDTVTLQESCRYLEQDASLAYIEAYPASLCLVGEDGSVRQVLL